MNASYDQLNVSAFREIDAAIDALDEALRSAGLPRLEAPDDPSAVGEVAEAVGNVEAAQAAAERFVRDQLGHRAAAVASDIRPLD